MQADDRERLWWDHAWQLFESESLNRARRLDAELAVVLEAIQFRLYVRPTSVNVAANFLVQFEREVRRALSLPIGERSIESFFRRFEARPRPESPRSAGLEILETRPGSLEWLLAPYGALEAVTSYAPLQVVSTAAWLVGAGAKISTIVRRNRDDPTIESRELGVVSMPDGTRVSVPAGGRLTVIGEGKDRIIEIDVGFGEQ